MRAAIDVSCHVSLQVERYDRLEMKGGGNKLTFPVSSGTDELPGGETAAINVKAIANISTTLPLGLFEWVVELWRVRESLLCPARCMRDACEMHAALPPRVL